jgi:hypothetical protein
MAKGKRVDIVKLIVDGFEVDAKECTKCHEVKVLSDFRVKASGFGGRDASCALCRSIDDLTRRVIRAKREGRDYHFIRRYQLEEITVDGVISMAKRCSDCGELKQLSDYTPSDSGKGGVMSYCKVCGSVRASKWRKENKERKRETDARWKADNKLRVRGHKQKRKAIKAQLPGGNVDEVLGSVQGIESTVKICRTCKLQKMISEFGRDSRGALGRKSKCRSCLAEEARVWRKENPDKHAEKQRDWYKQNPSATKAYNARWRSRNPDKKAAQSARRNARKRGLPASPKLNNTWVCALTGADTNVTLEHWLPLNIGHGGTIIGNIYPLVGSLNFSKKDMNPFEWFEANRQRLELSQDAFDLLVGKLAAQCGLTSKEFRSFTYWCFKYSRTVEQIAADNTRYGYKKSSLEIWREQTGLPFPIAVDFGNTTLNNEERSVA